MLKKFKRYIDNLSYKKTEYFILYFCIMISLLLLFFLLFSQDISTRESLFIIFFGMFIIPVLVGSFLHMVLNCDNKRKKEEIELKNKELKDLLINSDNFSELIVSNSTEYFPKDIVLFYLEQIYITDKDIKENKIVYPHIIKNPLYIKSHFEI